MTCAYFRSRQPLSLHEWHVVRVSRTGRDGYMQIDNQAAVEGLAKGAYTQLTLTLDLFIGGHRNFDEIAKNANLHKSFKGCIQKVGGRIGMNPYPPIGLGYRLNH